MDRPGIGSARDDPVKGINLAHQVPFAQSSNRRIAAHRSNRIKIETHQRNMRTHPRSRSRSFDPGMAPADNDDIELLHNGSGLRASRRKVGTGFRRSAIQPARHRRMFHVEQSFPDAEPTKQRVEHILSRGTAEQSVKRHAG